MNLRINILGGPLSSFSKLVLKQTIFWSFQDQKKWYWQTCSGKTSSPELVLTDVMEKYTITTKPCCNLEFPIIMTMMRSSASIKPMGRIQQGWNLKLTLWIRHTELQPAAQKNRSLPFIVPLPSPLKIIIIKYNKICLFENWWY